MRAIGIVALIALMAMPAFAGDPPVLATVSRKEATKAVAKFLYGKSDRVAGVACLANGCTVYREKLDGR